jgi:DNA-binding MltR family transcriptional regulator
MRTYRTPRLLIPSQLNYLDYKRGIVAGTPSFRVRMYVVLEDSDMADDAQQAQPPSLDWQNLSAEDKETAFQILVNLKEYFRLLRKETDRGCAMIVAAHLDQQLGELLRGCMTRDEEYTKEMSRFFDPDGPLGSFSTRTKLAHYLNLISKQVRQDLDTIRKIRNDFAHKLEFEDFNTPSVRDRCMNLQHDMLDSRNPRERFINTACVLLVFIDFFSKHGVGGIMLGANPRYVESALMQDIANAFVSVISQESTA